MINRKFKNMIQQWLNPICWPPIEQELSSCHHLLHGRMLNAGSGNRDLSSLIDGYLVNVDLPSGLHNQEICCFGSLENLPFFGDRFDGLICNAVLEHVRYPIKVVEEFFRVLIPQGHLILTVPFMQPEHLDPTDFQRYTRDGLTCLVENAGFQVQSIENVHNVYFTLAWIAQDWLGSRKDWGSVLLKLILFPFLRWGSKNSKTYVHSIASAYRIIALKPPLKT